MAYYCPFCEIEIDYSGVPHVLTDEARYLHSCGYWVDFRLGNDGPDAVIRELYRGWSTQQCRQDAKEAALGALTSDDAAAYRKWSRRQKRLEDEHYAWMAGYVWEPIVTTCVGFALAWLVVAEPRAWWHLALGGVAGLMLGMFLSQHVTHDVSCRLGQARDEIWRKADREMREGTQEH